MIKGSAIISRYTAWSLRTQTCNTRTESSTVRGDAAPKRTWPPAREGHPFGHQKQTDIRKVPKRHRMAPRATQKASFERCSKHGVTCYTSKGRPKCTKRVPNGTERCTKRHLRAIKVNPRAPNETRELTKERPQTDTFKSDRHRSICMHQKGPKSCKM